jgi:hypothetical protein
MLYTFLIEQQTNERPHISVTGVLKPLSIGSITNLIKSEPIYVQNKVTYQLARINNLISDIQYQINNPKYEKVKQNNSTELRFVRDAQTIHASYFRRILNLKKSGRLKNIAIINRLEMLYKKNLFTLSQKYKKFKLDQRLIAQQAVQNENPVHTQA